MSGGGRAFSIVLHTHMPYVEGFGTWPFGEEWLWEAMATCYLPLLDVLDAAPDAVTLSVTPVLADQLAAPGVPQRFGTFLRELREASHALDLEAHPDVAPQLEHSRERYRAALRAFEARGGDLVGALAPHVAWTSAATHAVLPLLATDAGVRLQVRTGVRSHRERFGAWGGGFWLPECAHDVRLDGRLEEAGVTHTCVELTDLGIDPRTPLRSPAGPLLIGIDREIVDLVWGAAGYPSRGAYLNTRAFTAHRHLAWSVDGAPYDPAAAALQAEADAEHFVARVRERLAGGGACVVALDTELLGHWWVEGVDWLRHVIAAAGDLLAPVSPDTLPAPAAAPPELPVTTWGTPRTLETWSGPGARGLAWRQRAAELRVLAAGDGVGERAVRELLALQSSDWAFLASRDTAGPYPLERADGHERELAAVLADPGAEPALRGLAPWLATSALREP
ncbi:MAG: 1,4-alpha-glucan branching enzyme [Solirubrobacteraceae bacterium]|nr:1,4-alpha-glucan branching enzyme [Solirubrobacteraceae bacterium]